MFAKMSRNSSSFAELTPVSLTASSSTTDAASDISQSVNLTKINEFNRLVEELGFEGDDEVQVCSDSDNEEEDEDVNVKYPYERKDQFSGLEERLEQRLKDDGSTEADEQLQEIEQLVKEAKNNGSLLSESSIFSCVLCAKCFSTAEKLQEHVKKTHDFSKNQFVCKLCGKSYKRKKNLAAHIVLHEKELQCKKCNFVFRTPATLTAHTTQHHKEDVNAGSETIECYMCFKQISESKFTQHLWYCRNKKDILKRKAENTTKSLSVPPSPAMSIASCASFASYQPGPSYSPTVSPASYVDKSCRVCGQTFASRQSMLRHVERKHPEAKDDANVTAVRYVSTESPTHQYACTDCGKRLTTRAALTTHRARIHLNSSRHECHHCHKKYPLASELRKHIQRVHEAPQKSKNAADLPDFDSIF